MRLNLPLHWGCWSIWKGFCFILGTSPNDFLLATLIFFSIQIPTPETSANKIKDFFPPIGNTKQVTERHRCNTHEGALNKGLFLLDNSTIRVLPEKQQLKNS